MLNFLPQNNKKKVVREYLYRFSSLFFLFLFFVLIILFSFFVPSYFFVTYKNAAVSDQLALSILESKNKKVDITATISDTNGLIRILSSEDTSLTVRSEILKKLLNDKQKQISLTSLNFLNNDDGSMNVEISGIAETREDLINFEKNLKNDSSFSNIDSPVSDLLKSINADFSVTLKYSKK